MECIYNFPASSRAKLDWDSEVLCLLLTHQIVRLVLPDMGPKHVLMEMV